MKQKETQLKFEKLSQLQNGKLIGGFVKISSKATASIDSIKTYSLTGANNCQAMNCVGCGSPTNGQVVCSK